MAGSPAWYGLPQCPGYGHWASYCCLSFVFESVLCLGSGFGNPANPGWGLRWVCLGTGRGFAPPFPAGVCGVCGWAWVLACTAPFLAGVLGRAWLCACSAFTLAFPARVCGVGVCAWARVSAAPRHSWLRWWGVCVRVRVPPCPLPLLAGGAVRGCVLGLGLQPRPATPGWGVGACVSFLCAPRLYSAPLGWGVLCGRVCLNWGFGCAPPLLVGALRCVCVGACAPLLPPHSWRGGVCVGWFGFYLLPGFFLAWVLGHVATCVRRVRFPLPSGGRACGVGVCGSCSGWGSPPPPLFFMLFRAAGEVWFSAPSPRGFLVSVPGCMRVRMRTACESGSTCFFKSPHAY